MGDVFSGVCESSEGYFLYFEGIAKCFDAVVNAGFGVSRAGEALSAVLPADSGACSGTLGQLKEIVEAGGTLIYGPQGLCPSY